METLNEEDPKDTLTRQTNWEGPKEFDTAELLKGNTDQSRCFQILSLTSDPLPFLLTEGLIAWDFLPGGVPARPAVAKSERITFKSKNYALLEELDIYTTPANKRKIFLALVKDSTISPEKFAWTFPQWADWYYLFLFCAVLTLLSFSFSLFLFLFFSLFLSFSLFPSFFSSFSLFLSFSFSLSLSFFFLFLSSFSFFFLPFSRYLFEREKFLSVCEELDKVAKSLQDIEDYKEYAKEAAKHKGISPFLFPMKRNRQTAAEFFASGELMSGSIETVDKKLFSLVFPK